MSQWSRGRIGWMYVAVQAVLLVALVALPRRTDWPTPALIGGLGYALIATGAVVVLLAALSLGRSLTPTPVPVDHGELQTSGLFGVVRHPIYSGVLAIVVGLVIRSGSWITLVVGAATVLFFNNKAKWEEQQLSDRYGDYEAYASKVPRFVPWFGAAMRQRKPVDQKEAHP